MKRAPYWAGALALACAALGWWSRWPTLRVEDGAPKRWAEWPR